MWSWVRAGWAAAALVWAGAPAQAIVIHDGAAAAGDALSLGAAYRSVVKITYQAPYVDPNDGQTKIGSYLCSGALISTVSVLTADHCVRNAIRTSISVGFTTGSSASVDFSRGVSEVFAFGADSSVDLLNGSDLAVLTLQSGVPDPLPFMLYDGSVVGDMGRFVGYGRNGAGTAGAGSIDGRRRAAENVIDWQGAAKACGGQFGCTFSNSTDILSIDFDDGSSGNNALGGPIVGSAATMTRYEGSTAGGDSGGPILVLRDEVWLIAGVTSGGSSALSQYGDVAWFTSVASVAAREFVMQSAGDAEYWVAGMNDGPDPDAPSPVPAPPAGLLLAGALAALALGRRAAA